MSKKNGKVFCEDGVEYSPQELAVIYEAGGVLDMATHMVKKAIGGEVVKIERTMGRGGAPQSVKSGHGDNAANNKGANEKVQGACGVGEEDRDGELEIY